MEMNQLNNSNGDNEIYRRKFEVLFRYVQELLAENNFNKEQEVIQNDLSILF